MTRAVKYLSAISLNERIKFLKLLLRWKGSLWKLLWADFLWFFILYIGVTVLYQCYLINDPIHKKNFEAMVMYMNKVAALVPLSFLLGFFVSTVLGRWWTVVNTIPWMTKPAFACQAYITEGGHEKCKDIRSTLVRYLNLAWIFSMMNLSKKIKDRFHVVTRTKKMALFKKEDLKKTNLVTIRERMDKINSDEIVKKYFGQLIMEEEIVVLENINRQSFLVPLMWSTKLVQRAVKAGHIKSDSSLMSMIQTFQANLESLSIFNEFNVPLVYTQVIVIVVYAFLLSEILSQQTVAVESSKNFDVYFPIFALFKFLIYMGWFKVGLCFINPFGSDQTDLPLDVILDFNLEVSSSIGHGDNSYYPEYLSDSFDDSVNDRFEIFNKFKSSSQQMKKNLISSPAINDGYLELQNMVDA